MATTSDERGFLIVFLPRTAWRSWRQLLSVASRGLATCGVAGALLLGCGGDPPPSTAAPRDDQTAAGAGSGGSVTVVQVRCEQVDDCEDGQACNGLETCEAGFCKKGEAVDCDDGVACTKDFCDQSSGDCSHAAPDRDGDGSVDAACVDADGRDLGDDCDDDDPDRYPGNAEICAPSDPEHDEDCDPTTFGDTDKDGDRFVDQACRNVDDSGMEFGGEDCNDAARSVNPDTSEVCDGFDNNCDGQVDEGLLIVGYRDKDGDGYGVPVSEEDALPGEVFDGDGKLYVCPGTPAIAAKSVDCDDADPLKRPDMFELCDLVDNNCNDVVDENVVAATWYADFDADGFGASAGPLRVSCEPQVGYSLYPEDCDDKNPLASPLQVEICDSVDNDCDGRANFVVQPGDLEDDDKDGFADPRCGTAAPDCDDLNPNTHPGARELCDGLDNDCNGAADTQVQSVLWYLDNDGDGFGNPLVTPVANCEVMKGRATKAGDCDDRDPTRNPGASDDCSGVPGSDDDCDGDVDEAEAARAYYYDGDGDGYGKLGSEPVFACQAPASWVAVSSDCNDSSAKQSPVASEVCKLNDGKDDDCDGDVDCADKDCALAPDCVGLLVVKLVTPQAPIIGLVATPFAASVSVETSIGEPVGAYKLDVKCLDGAYSPDSSVTTNANGVALLTIYPGLALGNYKCTIGGASTLPLTLSVQAVGPPLGSVHSVFNVGQRSLVAPADGAAALGSDLWQATALDVASDGTLYVLAAAGKIYEVSPRGVVKDLLASGGTSLSTPVDLALNRAKGVLYILGGTPRAVYGFNVATRVLTKVAGGGASSVFQAGMSGVDYAFTAPHHLAVQPGVGVAIADTNSEVVLLRDDGTLGRFETNKGCATLPCVTSCAATSCQVAVSDAGALLMTGTFNTEAVASDLVLARLASKGSPAQLTFSSGSGPELALNALDVGAPHALSLDPAGNLLLAHDDRVRWIGRTELVARDVIGGSAPGSSGDYGQASAALVQNVQDVALDGFGSLWVLEGGTPSRVRRVWKPTAPAAAQALDLTLVSAAPSGLPGHQSSAVQVKLESSPGVAAAGVPVFFDSAQAALSRQGPAVTGPTGLATRSLWTSMTPGSYGFTATVEDLTGSVVAAKDFTATVTTPTAGTLTSVANTFRRFTNTGIWPSTPFAPNAPLGSYVQAAAARADGTIYFISDRRVYRLGTDGSLRAVAGGGASVPDHVPGLTANIGYTYGLAIDENRGRAYLAGDGYIYVLELVDHVVWTLTGQGNANVEAGPASQWSTHYAYSVAVSKEGNDLFFQDNSPAIFRIDLQASPPTRHTVLNMVTAGNTGVCPANPGVPFTTNGATDVSLAQGADGLLYATGRICGVPIPSQAGHALYTVNPKAPTQAEMVKVLAPITSSHYGSIAVDAAGRVYLSYAANHTVVRWAPSGQFTHIAGLGTAGDSGDQGPATLAQLSTPRSVALTPDGHLLIADYSNYTIRKVWSP